MASADRSRSYAESDAADDRELNDSNRTILAVWWGSCLLWSAGWLFIKVGLHDLPPLTFAAMRLTLAALILVPLVSARREWTPLRPRDLLIIGASGLLLLGVNYALVFWGAQFVPSAMTAVLQATSPVYGFCFGLLLGTERFTAVRALAIALGMAGVAVVSGGQLSADHVATSGSLAIVLGAVCVAGAYAMLKGRVTHVPPAQVVTIQTLCALPPLVVAGVWLDGSPAAIPWTARAVAALLYLGIVNSVLAFCLNYWLLRRVDATIVLSTMLVQPFIAALLASVFLGERLGPQAVAGGVCILMSAALILRTQR